MEHLIGRCIRSSVLFVISGVVFLVAVGILTSLGNDRAVQAAINGDVNGDGVVNSVDAALILQFDAGLVQTIPPKPTLTPEPTPAPPAAPTELRFEILSSSEVRLTWRDNATTETGFFFLIASDIEIYEPIIYIPDLEEYIFSLFPGQAYGGQVWAVNENGWSAPSNAVEFTMPAE